MEGTAFIRPRLIAQWEGLKQNSTLLPLEGNYAHIYHSYSKVESTSKKQAHEWVDNLQYKKRIIQKRLLRYYITSTDGFIST